MVFRQMIPCRSARSVALLCGGTPSTAATGSMELPTRFPANSRASVLNVNTVEIGASHSLLLPWVWRPSRHQGGCDDDATRTIHAAARCHGPDLGPLGGLGTDYPARGRSP